ncbi:Type-1 restriction enzyme EcoDI specificity protein [Planktothrix rubescens]|nr:Type-1 restriction enzyme EcoDI specificity protein [Planktothrix rubescens]
MESKINYVSLNEISTIQTGKKDANYGDKGGEYPFFTCADKPILSPTYSFDGESIILPGNGANVGMVFYHVGKFEAYQRTYVLNNIKCNSRYLFHHLSAYWKKFNLSKQFGSATNYIRMQNFLDYTIPLPPIASQRTIANILDKADEIIRKRKEAIALTEQLLKSTFLDMFGDPVINPKGWDVVTLEQVAEKEKGAIKCGPFGSQLLISEFQDIGIPVYGIDNVQKNEFIWAKPKFITREKYQQLRAFSIKLNDVLISRTGTVGRTCIAPPNIPESIIGANLLKVSLDQNEMSSKYLSYALSYSEFLIQEIKNMSPGATVPVFNTSNLKSLKLANPPMDLQIKFNLMINKIQEKIGKQKKSLQESENLFNSLLQKAFKGEL